MIDDRNNPKIQILIAKYLSGILSDNDVDLFNRLISNDPKYLKYLNDFELSIESFLGTNASATLRASRDHQQKTNETCDSWPTIAPGISGKVLHYDHMVGAMIYIAKLEPGAQCIVAEQGSPEECMLISGDFSLLNETLKAGDRYSAPKSIIHSGGYTESGAILLIRAQDS
ncbi:MAG: hypothetical protein CMO98_10485 [Woeseia sp.]|nr:hypothetical protein [Woeseia sp.]|tara:strand:- start:868 stop:1380 length:513 start_codon:yes stop_codon:yes gene_type:complete